MVRATVIFARDGSNPPVGSEIYMKLPAAAGNFIYISEIYMKMPATAGIFIYISEIYMKMPAAAGNFIYISEIRGLYTPI